MKKYILPICVITLILVLTTLTFSSANTSSQEFTWNVLGKATETFQEKTLELDKGQIPNNEYLFQSNGAIEFFYRSDGDLRITLEKTSEEQVTLATADSRSSDIDPCNWNDNRCIVDRNGQLLFASTWDGSSSIDDKNYQQCPVITCGINGQKCSKDDIKEAAVAQDLDNDYKCMSKPFTSEILAGEKIKTYYNNGGNIGIRISEEKQEQRTSQDSGIDSISLQEGNKLVAIFSAAPQAESSGTLSPVLYELSDDNPKVITSLQGNEVHACLDSNQDDICDYLQINNNLQIKINSPINNNIYNTSQILVNIDSQGTSTWFSINSGNNEQYNSPIIKTFQQGANILTAYTENQFGAINSTFVIFQVNTTIQTPKNDTNQTDTTPPGKITNLHLINATNSSLKWQWNNPADSDFSKAIIYFDNNAPTETSFNMFEALNLQPNTTHTITILTKDISGNINNTPVSSSGTTFSNPQFPPVDNSAPSSVTNLTVFGITNSTITWTWNNPADSDFSKAIIYFDGANILNTTSETFTTNNLQANTTHSIIIHTYDLSGNINNTDIFSSATTLSNQQNPPTDNLPPGTITNLNATQITNTTITWTWQAPSDNDFSHVIVFLDGINSLNTTSNSFQAIGLTQNSTHTVTIHTADFNGNINNTDVSNTATTLLNHINQTQNDEGQGQTPEDDIPTNNDDDDSDDSSNKGGGSKTSSSFSRTSQPLFIPLESEAGETNNLSYQNEKIVLDSRYQKSKISYINLILIILLILIIVLILFFYLISR